MKNLASPKIRLAVIGAGWRAHCYIRIANALPELFEKPIVLVRSREKAEALRAQEGLYATERTGIIPGKRHSRRMRLRS